MDLGVFKFVLNDLIVLFFSFWQHKPVAFAIRTNVMYAPSLDDDPPVKGRALYFGVRDFLHIKEVFVIYFKKLYMQSINQFLLGPVLAISQTLMLLYESVCLSFKNGRRTTTKRSSNRLLSAFLLLQLAIGSYICNACIPHFVRLLINSDCFVVVWRLIKLLFHICWVVV